MVSCTFSTIVLTLDTRLTKPNDMGKLAGETTPLMKQYWDIKSAHQDKILLFRMGDFFEMFYEDAQTAAPLLGVALTSRNKKSADQTPMCGVPHHSIANHINKLLAHGLKVAICDQVEDAKNAKGIVKRAVTRILSPGMVFDPDTLDVLQFNYLAAFDQNTVSFLEPTTGEAFYYQVSNGVDQEQLLRVLNPVELILSAQQMESLGEKLKDRFLCTVHEDLNSEGARSESSQRLISYAVHMQGPEILKTLNPFSEREYGNRLQVGEDVLRHLEVFRTYKGDIKGSLFEAINCSQTAGGSRRLKQWLCFPLRNLQKIRERHDQIQFWLANTEALQQVRQHLRGVGDLERRLGKISHPNAHPRDLKNLAATFSHVFAILNFFPEKVQAQKKIQYWLREIERIFVDEIPQNYREGGMIQKGISEELDELILLSTNSQQKVLELEIKEKQLTQIPSLKIRYNNVFGYYIEVTHTHVDKVPLDRYQRKQTLTNAERYTTDELVELERKVVSARSRRSEVEIEIYQQLKCDLLAEMREFLFVADFLNDLDVVTGLAWLALESNMTRPQFSQEGELLLKSSRHPVVEKSVSFVANDIHLRQGECLLLTGPNMAGKSTIMRQVAISALLAQAGSFVPAKSALLPLFDRIFTRIGASDFLAEGLSTFMVEMKETAHMLKESTGNSLLVLDEVGRGTSTYDGLSLAQAILEYLINEKKPLIFFATHYHELTALSEQYKAIVNAHMSIHENKGQLHFLYTLAQGPAQRSYGIQVAQLAGMPLSVIKNAEKLLHRLEGATKSGVEPMVTDQLDLWSASPQTAQTDPLAEKIAQQVKDFSIQTMTPLDALNKIAQWQQELF